RPMHAHRKCPMTIGSVKPFVPDPPAQAATQRPADSGDFAAVARSVVAGDLAGARAALAGTPRSATAATLAETLDAGNLAAARLALSQLGTDPFAARTTAAAGPPDAAAP